MPYADPEDKKRKQREYYLKTRDALLATREVARREAGIPKRVPMTEEKRKEYHRNWNKRDRTENPEKQKAVLKKSREKHYEKRLAGNRKWVMENPEKQQKIRRRSRYGITPEMFDSMVLEQEGLCAICKEQPERLVIDHCHDTGKVRGLLCLKCNSGIGLLRDSASVVENALTYLTRFKD